MQVATIADHLFFQDFRHVTEQVSVGTCPGSILGFSGLKKIKSDWQIKVKCPKVTYRHECFGTHDYKLLLISDNFYTDHEKIEP